MKANLEFNLPEDRAEYLAALQGSDWKNVVWYIDQQLRNWLKYGHEFKTVDEALQATRAKVINKMEGQNLTLEQV